MTGRRMDSGPPLNLSTSVRVADSNAVKQAETLELRSELVKQSNGNESYVVLKPTSDENETLTITGEAVNEASVEETNATSGTDKSGAESVKKVASNKNYECSHCSQTFHRAAQLRLHEKAHNEEKVHHCDQCHQAFFRVSLLLQHKQEHNKKPYSCPDCNLPMNSYTSLRIHKKEHRNEKRYKCNQCAMSFGQQSHLITHMRKHTGEKPYGCHVCNTRFKQISHLTTHMRIHTNDRPYLCDICNASFSQTGSLRRHKRSHTGEKPFKCEQCCAVFVEKRNLHRHKLAHSGIRPFKCDLCTSSFTQLIDLKRHKLSHSGIKPYKCDICEAAFSRKNNLKWHKLTHEGNTPHICDVCSVGFRIARDLKSHKRSHIENKPHSCGQCNSTFAQATTLKRHMLMHRGTKSFSCPKCSATFFERSSLKRHIQRHGNVKPYSCEYCMTSFLEARALKRHKIVVHKEGKYGEIDETETVFVEDLKLQVRDEKNSCSVEEENPLHIYEPSYQKAAKSVSVPKNEPELIEMTSSQNVSQVFVNELNPQHNSQIPTLVLTQPGQPPRTGRPAMNCPNHNAHIHTFLEGSYNQWQAWCFCDPSSIPSQSDSVPSSDSQSLVLTSDMQPVVTQATTLEFHSSNLSHSLPSNVEHSHSHQGTMQVESSPLPHMKCNIQDEEVTPESEFQNSQQNYQSSVTYQHYNNQVYDANTGLPVLSDGHHSSTNNLHHSIQGGKTTYIQIPTEEIVSNAYQSTSSGNIQKREIVYERDHGKGIAYESSGKSHSERDTILPDVPHIDSLKNSLLHETETSNNMSHGSVIMVSNENSNTSSLAKVSDVSAFHGVQSSITSTSSHHNSVYENHYNIGPNKGLDANETQNIAALQSQNQLYEQLPQTVANDGKNEVTIQYSLTVNNPATGDIQIQSDVFPVKSTVSESPKPPIKKRKMPKPSALQERLNCPFCTKTFVKQNLLDMHIRCHTGEKPFICGICNQNFSHNNSLTIHMRSHTGERPYSCIYCGATFTQKSNLRVHHRTHTGEKPFKCSVCEASFSQGSHLKAHLRIHNNDRPFVCPVCGQAFTQKSALKRHQMKHSGLKPHACDECNAKFSQRDDLKRHRLNHSNQNRKSKHSADSKKKKMAEAKPVNKSEQLNVASVTSENLEQAAASNESTSYKQSEDCSEKNYILATDTEQRGSISDDKENSDMRAVPETEEVKDEDIRKNYRYVKASKCKEKPLLEPTRISRRIREAAERRKFKIEDSDFITGDLDEIDEAEELQEVLIKVERAKGGKKKELSSKKIVSEEVVQSWCFCEVPHGPDEPHTVAESLRSEHKFSDSKSASTTQLSGNISVPQNLLNNSSSRESSLQHRLQEVSQTVILQADQVVQNSQTPAQIGFAVNQENLVLNHGTTMPDVQVISSNNSVNSTPDTSSVGTHILPANNQLLNSHDLTGQVAVVEGDEGKTIYGSAQIISGQLLSGGQFLTSDGTFFLEAGDIIGNGTVVLSSSPGTFYFDLGPDGQLVNMPTTANMSQEPSVIVAGTTVAEHPANAYSSTNQNDSSIPTSSVTFSSGPSNSMVDSSHQSTTVLATSVDGTILSSLHNSEVGGSTSHMENVHYTSLDNEMTLFSANGDMQCVTVKQRATTSEKAKTNLPIVVNPCKCSVCGKVFAQKVTLRSHMAEAHPGLYFCVVCSDAFTTKEHLITHKLQHQSTFTCPECSQIFTAKNALSQHRQKQHKVSRYSGVKKEKRSFMCAQCDSRFYQLSDLKRHALGHTGEKPFKCWQCGAGFTRKFSLKKHERIHTGEKPYTCKECDQSFAYRHQFNRHCSTHVSTEEPRVTVSFPQVMP